MTNSLSNKSILTLPVFPLLCFPFAQFPFVPAGVIPEDMPTCIERELINGGRVSCPDPETVKPPTRFVCLFVCLFELCLFVRVSCKLCESSAGLVDVILESSWLSSTDNTLL